VRRVAITVVMSVAVLGVWGVVLYRWRFPPLPPAPTVAELEALNAERESLRLRFEEVFRAKGDQGFAEAPKAGLLIGIPTSFTRSIVEELVTGMLGDVTLTLRNVKAHHEGEVKVKGIFKKKTIGLYALQINLSEIVGHLKPGKPVLTFGGNRIGIVLPVNVPEARATATLHFKWDGKGFAGLVCGDMELTRDVAGRVVPTTYVVRGRFDLSQREGALVVDPEFGEVRINVRARPTDETWAVVEKILDEKGGACGLALDKVDVRKILERIVEGKGFNVKLPDKLFRPIRLPAGVQQSLEIQGVRLDVRVQGSALSISPTRFWYGADISTQRPGAAGVTEPPPPRKEASP
jgi:hypothetical protein